MLTAKGRGIARSLLTYYALPFRQRRMLRFYRGFIQPGDLCFDVGAHVGNRSRALLRAGGRVVAVEPQPPFPALLRRLYGRHPRFTLVEVAVGGSEGEADLLVSSRFPTVSTLSPEWAEWVGGSESFNRVRWDQRVRVPVTTLDRLIARFGVPRFIKIDVEGLESEVLSGLTTPVEWLAFEYLPAVPDSALTCLDQAERLGRYRYACTVGERQRFESPAWLGAEEMRGWLRALSGTERSGDIYARLGE
jgi:FkbM family methyltransferase